MHVTPDYFSHFKCTAAACTHNCCIGWEIDIDESSLRRYKNLDGEMGVRLSNSISEQDTPHFILQNERCPFLNRHNLCDIITALGETALCDICKEHPRFHNALPGRIESGLGLCCEAAGALILGQKEPMRLICDGTSETQDDIILLRDKVLTVLQDRRYTLADRLEQMLVLCETRLPEISDNTLGELFLSLERLEAGWEARLQSMRAPTAAFGGHMSERQSEYEQLCVYLIYRHFANAATLSEAAAVACFTAVAYRLLYTLGASQFETTGVFTFADQVELCRQFSAEIEYSDENLERLLTLFLQ